MVHGSGVIDHISSDIGQFNNLASSLSSQRIETI